MTSAGGDEAALIQAVLRAAGVDEPTAVEVVGHGLSGDLVFRVGGVRRLFGKIADPRRRTSAAELGREIGMLRWLDGAAGAARLAWTGEAAGVMSMLTEAIEGVALHALDPAEAERGALAGLEALARLHALPIETCPFDERLAVKLAAARRHLERGEVDLDRLEPHNLGRPIADVWRDLLARRPADEDLVVTHGDASWPNFILRPDSAAGMVDLGRGGVADRCQDLALFIRSAKRNFPLLPIDELVARGYPLGAPDAARLTFYRELDEFF